MKWKNYELDFCDLCESVFYICYKCGDNSCGLRGCNICNGDLEEFKTTEWYKIITRSNWENKVFDTINKKV